MYRDIHFFLTESGTFTLVRYFWLPIAMRLWINIGSCDSERCVVAGSIRRAGAVKRKRSGGLVHPSVWSGFYIHWSSEKWSWAPVSFCWFWFWAWVPGAVIATAATCRNYRTKSPSWGRPYRSMRNGSASSAHERRKRLAARQVDTSGIPGMGRIPRRFSRIQKDPPSPLE